MGCRRWDDDGVTIEGLKCCLLLSMMPPEIVGEKMEPECLYDFVNVLLSLQNGGLSAWKPAGAAEWLERKNGGWEESYLSCPNKTFIPLEGNQTNLVRIAWAMMEYGRRVSLSSEA
ncbi:hypothetical protein M0R45_030534 [Rubus argutus]|uniref:Uncharacterized protein n=1 Tax=Rubus argutus TaxID=59490 RepID=A0AAW1WFI2_RUBAR